MGIISNSMILVVIALDRYMAVKKILRSSWEPTRTFCFIIAIFIWALAAGISSPNMMAFSVVEYGIILTNPDDHDEWYDIDLGHMFCYSNKKSKFVYFLVVFLIIFMPLLIIFIWLNGIIAKEIFSRRHPLEEKSHMSTSYNIAEMTSTEKRTSETNSGSNSGYQSKSKQQISVIPIKLSTQQTTSSNSGSQRKTRQLRIFCVLIIIILVFFILRLPTWIFLLIKSSNTFDDNSNWSLNTVFGTLSIANCALNPFLYTFLSKTIMITSKINNCLSNTCAKLFGCCYCSRDTKYFANISNESTNLRSNSIDDKQKSGVYIGDGEQ